MSNLTRKLKRASSRPMNIPRCQRRIKVEFQTPGKYQRGELSVSDPSLSYSSKEVIDGVIIVETLVHGYGPRFNTIGGLHPLKGKRNGRCNRTSCQTPLEHEAQHQWMGGIYTGGPHLYYCARCSGELDKWDRIDNPQGPRRIERAPRLETDPQGDR
jgi:hypothetical protein